MSYWEGLFSNPGFMGSLIGAIISGLIAIFIMYRSNVKNIEREKKNSIINFLKETDYLLYAVESLIEQINAYIEYQLEDESIVTRIDKDGFPTIEISEVKFAKEINKADIKESINKIKSVDRKSFTRDTLQIYLEILNVTEGQIEYFWKRSLEKDVDGVATILEEATKKLINLKCDLENIYKIKEKEYL